MALIEKLLYDVYFTFHTKLRILHPKPSGGYSLYYRKIFTLFVKLSFIKRPFNNGNVLPEELLCMGKQVTSLYCVACLAR